MKRLLMLMLAMLVAMPVLMLPNCSDPLESITDPEPYPPRPVDTVYITDTVYIIEPGPGETQTVCSILLSNLYEIIWMFHNSEGTYDLHFDAVPVRDFTFRTLTVDIDGQQFEWPVGQTLEFTAEGLYLNAFATIKILTDQPCLQGHEVDICLTIAKPE
ncbi:MAG: hypothetical protein JSV52_03020 [Candidatus Zixiibacteriota bacterium]|nr:MAG: hypothetical protein JSV52_03020 [candidate division Zixibacteria bacterium]